MNIMVNLIGILLILFIICWFWLSKGQAVRIAKKSVVEIRVKDGIYQPATIETEVGYPITLRFIREDASPCSEFVVFNNLNISRSLPLNEPTDITITLPSAGKFEFTCQMGMYRGLIIAK